MSVIQLNSIGAVATDEGYISSITIRSAGGPLVYTPDGTGKIGVTGNALSNAAYTLLLTGKQYPVGGTLTPVSA